MLLCTTFSSSVFLFCFDNYFCLYVQECRSWLVESSFGVFSLFVVVVVVDNCVQEVSWWWVAHRMYCGWSVLFFTCSVNMSLFFLFVLTFVFVFWFSLPGGPPLLSFLLFLCFELLFFILISGPLISAFFFRRLHVVTVMFWGVGFHCLHVGVVWTPRPPYFVHGHLPLSLSHLHSD